MLPRQSLPDRHVGGRIEPQLFPAVGDQLRRGGQHDQRQPQYFGGSFVEQPGFKGRIQPDGGSRAEVLLVV